MLGLAGISFYNFGDPNPGRWFALSLLAIAILAIWIWNGMRLCRLSVIVFLFVGYSALSLLWSPDWRAGVLSLYGLCILSVLFVAAARIDRKTLTLAVPAVASLGVWISLIGGEFYPWTYGLHGNENFNVEFLMLATPLCLIGFRKWGIASAVVGGGLVAIDEAATKYAGFVGLGALIVGFLIHAKQYRFAAIVSVAGLIAIALIVIAGPQVPGSFLQRFELSYNTLLMWLDRPFGAGLGSFDYLYPLYQERHLWLIESHTVYAPHLFAGAAHNEFVQGLAVFGLPGAALLIWLICGKWRTDEAAVIGVVTVSILCGLCLVNFPFQNPATAALGVFALGLAIKRETADRALVPFRLVRGRFDAWRSVDTGRTALLERPLFRGSA